MTQQTLDPGLAALRLRPVPIDWILYTRRARRDAARELWAGAMARTGELVTAAADRLAGVEVALRPLSRPAALAITALLMFDSFLTVSAVLAAAGVAPREAALLPLTFGPVFVLAVKTAVGARLASVDPDRRPSGRARVVFVLLPALVLAVAGLVAGVGLKSMALGSVLDDRVTSVSSLLLFAALALGELVGAAASWQRAARYGRSGDAVLHQISLAPVRLRCRRRPRRTPRTGREMTARDQRPPSRVPPRGTNRVGTAILVMVVILAPIAVALVTLVATVVLPVLLRLGGVLWGW